MAKRRANGEGSIRKRSDGRWEGRYVAGHDPETGKAIRKNVLGKTQAEVKAKLKKAIETAQTIELTGNNNVSGEFYTWLNMNTRTKGSVTPVTDGTVVD